MKRVRSGHGFIPNRNTEWLTSKGFWAYYIGLLVIIRLLLGAFLGFIGVSDNYAFAFLHVLHTLITFPIMHWLKGAPFWNFDDEGENDKLTFWEQIDHGMQATATRKYFSIVPVVLFLLASVSSSFESTLMGLNFIVLLVCIIPKMGFMHKQRIGGINQD